LRPSTRSPPVPGSHGDNPLRGNPLLLQEYLMSMLNMPPMMGASASGRMGDYVYSQDALEQIMNQLMENGHKPVPLPEGEIENLPRDVLRRDSPLLGKDCQICQDTFADPDVADPNPTAEPPTAGMLTTVELPCHHAFHEDCIVPWLKQSGTCPVCRYALTPQPAPHGPPGSPSSPGSSNGNSSSPWAQFFSNPFGGGGPSPGSSSGPPPNNHGSNSGSGGNNNGSSRSTFGFTRRPSDPRNRRGNIPGSWDGVD